jgi:hypothetical protein
MLLQYCRAFWIQTKRRYLIVRRNSLPQAARQTDIPQQSKRRGIFSKLSRAVNRRTLAFGFATVTGMIALALLLIPSWQALNLGSFSEGTEPKTSQIEKSVTTSQPSKVEPESESEMVLATPPTDVPSPFENHQSTEPPVLSASPFESPKEPKPTAEKVGDDGLINQPPIDLNNPFPLPSVARKNNANLSVELSRIPNKPDTDEQFLVTSLSTTKEPVIPGGKLDNVLANDRDSHSGWRKIGAPNNTGEVIPTKYHATTSSLTVPVTVTLSTRWIVSSPKLRCEIEAPKTATVNGMIPIRIRVTNTGTAKAENVVLHVDLPKSLKYHVGRSLTHTIGTLEPGKTHVARLTPQGVAAGTAEIRVRTFADGDVSSSQEKRIELLPR